MVTDIYVDIDTIFDTRLSIAMGLDGNKVSDELMNKKYYERQRDNIGNVSYDIIMTYFKHREKSVLGTALPTPIIDIIKEQILEMKTDLKNNEDKNFRVKLYVNLYPYYFNTEELINMERLLTGLLGSIDIEYIYMSIPDLTPKWVVEHVGTMYYYLGPYWLEYHFSNLNIIKTPLLDITLITSGIMTMNMNNKKIELQDIMKFQDMMKLVIDYHTLPPIMFSGIL